MNQHVPAPAGMATPTFNSISGVGEVCSGKLPHAVVVFKRGPTQSRLSFAHHNGIIETHVRQHDLSHDEA